MSWQSLCPGARVYMERVEPGRNVRRFYALTIQPDLFGGYSLVREWGRIGHPGRVKLTQQVDAHTALRKLARAIQAKQRRGYREIA